MEKKCKCRNCKTIFYEYWLKDKNMCPIVKCNGGVLERVDIKQ